MIERIWRRAVRAVIREHEAREDKRLTRFIECRLCIADNHGVLCGELLDDDELCEIHE